jgi:hypothetical protein
VAVIYPLGEQHDVDDAKEQHADEKYSTKRMEKIT